MHPIQKKLYDLEELRLLINDPSIEIIEKDQKVINIQKLFDETYYSDGFPKIVLCGINPGRKGAGIVGVPFVDPITLDKRLPDNNIIFDRKQESSAQFFNKIVDYFGANFFYKHFYVTNISWFGFTKYGININYYDLQHQAQECIYKNFKREIISFNPTTIIPLGEKVEKSLTKIFNKSEIKIESRLNHPSWCKIGREDECKTKYIELLGSYVN